MRSWSLSLCYRGTCFYAMRWFAGHAWHDALVGLSGAGRCVDTLTSHHPLLSEPETDSSNPPSPVLSRQRLRAVARVSRFTSGHYFQQKVCLSLCLSVCLSVCMYACMYACLSLSVCLSVRLCLYIFVSVYLSVYLSLYLPVNLTQYQACCKLHPKPKQLITRHTQRPSRPCVQSVHGAHAVFARAVPPGSRRARQASGSQGLLPHRKSHAPAPCVTR